jgi:NADP-dependent 3-hydroxy acid dehydrogenase YdfG
MEKGILITGASGVLGTNLCQLLSRKNIPFYMAGERNRPIHQLA